MMKYGTQILLSYLAAQANACGAELADGENEFTYEDLGDNWLRAEFHSPLCA